MDLHELPKWHEVQAGHSLCIRSNGRIKSDKLGCKVIKFTLDKHHARSTLGRQFFYWTIAGLLKRSQVFEKAMVIVAHFVSDQHCV